MYRYWSHITIVFFMLAFMGCTQEPLTRVQKSQREFDSLVRIQGPRAGNGYYYVMTIDTTVTIYQRFTPKSRILMEAPASSILTATGTYKNGRIPVQTLDNKMGWISLSDIDTTTFNESLKIIVYSNKEELDAIARSKSEYLAKIELEQSKNDSLHQEFIKEQDELELKQKMIQKEKRLKQEAINKENQKVARIRVAQRYSIQYTSDLPDGQFYSGNNILPDGDWVYPHAGAPTAQFSFSVDGKVTFRTTSKLASRSGWDGNWVDLGYGVVMMEPVTEAFDLFLEPVLLFIQKGDELIIGSTIYVKYKY